MQVPAPPVVAFLGSKLLRNRVIRLNVPLPASAVVYGVADLTRTLEPNQIYFRSSREDHAVVGDVLITKTPALYRHDMRKFEAVDCEQLHGVSDVVVFSVHKHERPPPSYMAGADLDGDHFMLFFDPALIGLIQTTGYVDRENKSFKKTNSHCQSNEDAENSGNATTSVPVTRPDDGIPVLTPNNHVEYIKKHMMVAHRSILEPHTSFELCNLGHLLGLRRRLVDATESVNGHSDWRILDTIGDKLTKTFDAPKHGDWVRWSDVRDVLSSCDLPRFAHYQVSMDRDGVQSTSLYAQLYDAVIAEVYRACCNGQVPPEHDSSRSCRISFSDAAHSCWVRWMTADHPSNKYFKPCRDSESSLVKGVEWREFWKMSNTEDMIHAAAFLYIFKDWCARLSNNMLVISAVPNDVSVSRQTSHRLGSVISVESGYCVGRREASSSLESFRDSLMFAVRSALHSSTSFIKGKIVFPQVFRLMIEWQRVVDKDPRLTETDIISTIKTVYRYLTAKYYWYWCYGFTTPMSNNLLGDMNQMLMRVIEKAEDLKMSNPATVPDLLELFKTKINFDKERYAASDQSEWEGHKVEPNNIHSFRNTLHLLVPKLRRWKHVTWNLAQFGWDGGNPFEQQELKFNETPYMYVKLDTKYYERCIVILNGYGEYGVHEDLDKIIEFLRHSRIRGGQVYRFSHDMDPSAVLPDVRIRKYCILLRFERKHTLVNASDHVLKFIEMHLHQSARHIEHTDNAYNESKWLDQQELDHQELDQQELDQQELDQQELDLFRYLQEDI